MLTFKKGDFIRPKTKLTEGLVNSSYILLFNPDSIFIVYSDYKNHLIFQYINDRLTYIEGISEHFKLITNRQQIELLQALYNYDD